VLQSVVTTLLAAAAGITYGSRLHGASVAMVPLHVGARATAR